ncbi:NYN domain-containing protein [Tautonia sp. JC769]|uniref:NYN domain-containing protein n=1 Tax=Tautonia TaxID=2680020 RepID=UPI00147627CD|nr:NYN domain-containing protein [Tautonia rosea]
MQRFVTFVDGSNLDGVLKHLNLRVDDYGSFYRYIFEQSVSHWGRTFAEGAPWESAQHARIYWYVVGKMDEWDLNDPKAESRLRNRFELNPRLRDSYVEDVIRKTPDISPERRLDEAWGLCFAETREWYEGKRRALERKKRFYHGVQSATDFVEIRQEGHWKVDLLHHNLTEKGLDTSMAVDMVALQDTYDVALLISGDADGIPGINYVKNKAKHVGVVEFRRGSRDESLKGASSRLKIAADFVVQIYEADLIRRDLSYRANPEYDNTGDY